MKFVACFFLALTVESQNYQACSVSSECGQYSCCLYNSNSNGRRLLFPLGGPGSGVQGQCIPMTQAGATCSLNMQEPYNGYCPCASGLVCTPSTSLVGNSVGVCAVYSGGAGVCSQDVFTCSNGRTVTRIPPACAFAPCDNGVLNGGCNTDIQTCHNGQTVGRVAPYCGFAACGPDNVCNTDTQACPGSGFIVRRVPPSCAFASCTAEVIPPGSCPAGQVLCDSGMQQRGIQCVLDTCINALPCQNHSTCGPGYYCYACFRCQVSQGCLLSAACAANPVLGDCSAVVNCLQQQNAIDGICPWANNTCLAVICPAGNTCVPGVSNYWTGSPQYSCVPSAAAARFAPSFLFYGVLCFLIVKFF